MNKAGESRTISAAELAALRLPGLPATKRGILNVAERERWPFVARPGRGGGRLYCTSHLPAAARAVLEGSAAAPVPANLRPVGRPSGSDFFTRQPEIADAVEAILARQSLAALRVLELLQGSFDVLPSRRTLARFIQRLEREKPALLASTRDPDLYKSRYRISLGRADGAVTHANQIWELDTTKADVLTKGGRKMILGVIDLYTRRARFLVAPSESGQSVRRLLIDTIRAWGAMPEMVKTDNGSGYVNASIVSALETLGIAHHRCLPGTPEGKPYVERLFGTFTRERAELLDGYSGHNVAQAQALRAKAKKATGRALIVPALEPEQLQQILDAWVDGIYHQRQHGSTGAAPLSRWASSPRLSARAPSEDVLRIALSALIGSAKVGKRGVQWKKGRYWSPALAAFVGRQVQLRRDEDDLGALFVFDENGHFIDTAVNFERAGVSEETFARLARRQQTEWIKEQRAELQAKQRAFRFEDARDALLLEDAERAGRVAIFPRPTVDRSTAQLASIVPPAAPALPRQAALDDALARTAPRRAKPLSPAEKVAAADRIIAAADRGEPADAAELRRARLYATSTEYRAEKLVTAPTRPIPFTTAQRRHSA